MPKTTESKNSEQHIRELSGKNNEPEWLLKKRLAAFDTFRSKPMPSFIYGLNMSMDTGMDLGQIDASKSGKPAITIQNNNKKVIIEDFEGMLKSHGKVLEEKFMSLAMPNEKFTSFHASFLGNLLFVYAPKNTAAKEPIEIASVAGSNAVFEHLIVLVGDNSKVTLVEHSKSNKNGYGGKNAVNTGLINNKNDSRENNPDSNSNNLASKKKYAYRSKIAEIFIGKNCSVNYGNVQLLGQNTFNFTVKKASVGANSTLNWMDCCLGSKATLSEVTTFLDGEGAATNNYGAFFGSKSQQFNLAARSIHNAPRTVSNILTKGALAGSSRCIYRGLVRMQQNAFGSDGYQKEDALLLSSDASADSIPNLEIENSDVRCSHGASIGRIDREKLFYMMSRGLNGGQAEKEYVKGFFEGLMQKMQIKDLRENVNKIIEERIG